MLRSQNCSSLDLFRALLSLPLMLARGVWGWICLSVKKTWPQPGCHWAQCRDAGSSGVWSKWKKYYQHLNAKLSQAQLNQCNNHSESVHPLKAQEILDICCKGYLLFMSWLRSLLWMTCKGQVWMIGVKMLHKHTHLKLLPHPLGSLLFIPYKNLYVRKDLKIY